MQRRQKYCSILLGLVLAGAAWGKVEIVPVEDLKPTAQHRQTALIITQIVEKYHYRKPELNDEVSAQIFERYLEALDPNRSFFSQEDLKPFEAYRDQFDNNLRRGHLQAAFEIYRHYRALVDMRVTYALNLIDRFEFDFGLEETYQLDRSEVPWASTQAELDDIWRRRLKNDVLSQRLSGKKDGEIKSSLVKRYESLGRRVAQMDSNDVFGVFINAFTLSVEPHTSYMSPRGSENFDIGMRLSLQGIGAVLRSKHEHTLVQSTVPGGPAQRSGQIKAGDRIVGVAQGEGGQMEDVIGWRLQDVVDIIRGPKDSTVRLEILPKSQGAGGRTREVVLVRDTIKLEDKAAKKEIIDNDPRLQGLRIGVIEIPAFYRDFSAQAAGDSNFRSSTRDVRQLLEELKEEDVDGIVIDLRQNGGGSLTEATELTGLFIEKGPVVQVKDSSGNIEVERDSDPEQVYRGPLAVLVNRNSASASEIFAGAIQDYSRGLIIGEPTFGKGTVQTLVDIGRHLHTTTDLGRLRLTMAQFFRVEGGSTQHRGVMPDIVFPTAKGAANHGERSLDNALPWASIKPALHRLEGVSSVATLRDLNAARIAKDPGFQFLVEQEDDIIQMEKDTVVPLNEERRRKEWDEREQARLDRLNRLRTFRGLEPLDSLRDEEELLSAEDDDEEGIGRIMLEEAATILADQIVMQRPLTAQAK